MFDDLSSDTTRLSCVHAESDAWCKACQNRYADFFHFLGVLLAALVPYETLTTTPLLYLVFSCDAEFTDESGTLVSWFPGLRMAI